VRRGGKGIPNFLRNCEELSVGDGAGYLPIIHLFVPDEPVGGDIPSVGYFNEVTGIRLVVCQMSHAAKGVREQITENSMGAWSEKGWCGLCETMTCS